MPVHVDAIYRDGALHPQQPLALPEGARVRVAIEAPLITPIAPDGQDPLAEVIGIGEGRPAVGNGRPTESFSAAAQRLGLLGCVEGPADLSTNRDYLEGFGERAS